MMLEEKEISSELESNSERKRKNLQDEKNMGFKEKGISFLREMKSSSSAPACGSEDDDDGANKSNPLTRHENSGCQQELTLSYLCDNSKLGFVENNGFSKNLLNSLENLASSSYKGKEIMVSEDHNEENNRFVERDFLCLNEVRGDSSKREAEGEETEAENKEKRHKIETLNLSLALPDVSLSLAGSNRVQNGGDLPARLRSSRSIQSLNNNTQTSYSNDFTAASLSYSYSHQFSHNPSCSLTRNSTENYEYSMGSHRRDGDHIWNCGEGTNGSVHSRFRPIGDGSVALTNNNGGGGSLLGNRAVNWESGNNSFYRTTSSDNQSFFPSELPARPQLDTQSVDSRGRGSEGLRGLENLDGGIARKLSRPERILREILSESIPAAAQIIQELPDETGESMKEYLKSVITNPERKDELLGLQRRLESRSDLSHETLAKAHKKQLEFFVAIKMGLVSFLSTKNSLSATELTEIFLLERCRNIVCKRLLPVDDCECKICSTKKGFCSECMCPVCLKFDCANNTCSWVGCDVCSHWCHADCGIQRNLIKPGPSLKGPPGTTEMQFHCIGCGHASEMFGFVKDVFMACAKAWNLETLIKELDCVKKIFRGSEDYKGKELFTTAVEMLKKLQNRVVTSSDVCNFIFQFFNSIDADRMSEFGASSGPPRDLTTEASLRKDAVSLQFSDNPTPKSSFYNVGATGGRQDILPTILQQNDIKASFMSNKIIEDEWSVKPSKKDGFDSLESVMLVKEAEARMFQSKADDARREAEGFRRIARIKSEKLEEDYAEKIAKLCLQETEQRRRKKLEELQMIENSHCDYYKMKMRMQAEIEGLLKRMEATKQQLV